MSSSRENTIGIVHWEALWAASNGEQLTVVIPAFFLQQHTPYLNGVLSLRLESIFGEGAVEFRLDPGDLEVSDRGTRYQPGDVVSRASRNRGRMAAKLREALEEAFREAGEIEVEQGRRARELEAHLRTTGTA